MYGEPNWIGCLERRLAYQKKLLRILVANFNQIEEGLRLVKAGVGQAWPTHAAVAALENQSATFYLNRGACISRIIKLVREIRQQKVEL